MSAWQYGRVLGWAVLLAWPGGQEWAEGQRLLVPQPKEVRWEDRGAVGLEAGRIAIVLGDRADEPERQASRMLRDRVARRYRQDWPIVAESKIPAAADTLILLGRRSTHALLDWACAKNNIRLSPDAPGHDGYIIRFVPEGNRRRVLVGGSNARGVIYGQDTLFQLIDREGERVVLRPASIRDWPSIPWRGRPQTHYSHYLEPGAMDCYMTSRINWIDLREGIYAFEGGAALEKDVLRRVIDEAHARDLVVYGTVNCGVPASERPAVLGTFREFIDLGVDGLWLSFDDKGPGEQPEVMVFEALELARAHGISGRRIAICPPKGSYQEIDTEFNRKIIAIPGIENAMVFWTRVPSAPDLLTAQRIGLDTRPSWWHNWTRPASGFTHIESNCLLTNGRRSYMQVPTLAEGWHAPGYEQLTDAGRFCESAMPWGGQGWGQYYIVPVIGWWAWTPEQHNFDATRSRIYDIVYGPGQVDLARRFDDLLAEVKKMFVYSVGSSEWLPLCPARLIKGGQQRPEALDMLNKLEDMAAKLAQAAPAESLLPEDLLERWYLAAMRDEVATGRAEAAASFPEYWWNDHQRAVLSAVYDGELARADAAIRSVRPRLLDEIGAIEQSLGNLRTIPEYVDWWRRRAEMNAGDWQQLIRQRREELAARVWWYGYAVHKLSDMLAAAEPPLGYGTGRWERRNTVLATVLPDNREMFWGDWIGGLYGEDHAEAAVFAFRHRTEGAAGAFSELPVRIPLSGDRRRLALMIFLSNVDKDTIGLHHVARRWAGHRRIQLLQEGRAIWEADLGIHRPEGEWFTVPLPELPATMTELRLDIRVEDLKDTRAYSIAFVGPIRLVQLPGR